MDKRMEQEMERTIEKLRSSIPQKCEKQTSIFTLLKIAVSEMNPILLIGLLGGILGISFLFTDVFSKPMVTLFCTTPLPLLLLFHCYVLRQNEALRELEDTFRYSYAEMLIARCTVISVYTVITLTALSVMIHITASVDFIRLALCGSLPAVYLCAILLLISAEVRSSDNISFIAIVIWMAFCFGSVYFPLNEILQNASVVFMVVSLAAGVLFWGISIFSVFRRNRYAVNFR